MDKQIKAKWVAALRSGRFKQGRNILHNATENTFCCLGVLCRIYPGVRDAGAEVLTDTGIMATRFEYKGDTARMKLPLSLSGSAGLNQEDPDSGARAEDQLIDLNDDLQYDFDQIANWIELHL